MLRSQAPARDGSGLDECGHLIAPEHLLGPTPGSAAFGSSGTLSWNARSLSLPCWGKRIDADGDSRAMAFAVLQIQRTEITSALTNI